MLLRWPEVPEIAFWYFPIRHTATRLVTAVRVVGYSLLGTGDRGAIWRIRWADRSLRRLRCAVCCDYYGSIFPSRDGGWLVQVSRVDQSCVHIARTTQNSTQRIWTELDTSVRVSTVVFVFHLMGNKNCIRFKFFAENWRTKTEMVACIGVAFSVWILTAPGEYECPLSAVAAMRPDGAITVATCGWLLAGDCGRVRGCAAVSADAVRRDESRTARVGVPHRPEHHHRRLPGYYQ